MTPEHGFDFHYDIVREVAHGFDLFSTHCFDFRGIWVEGQGLFPCALLATCKQVRRHARRQRSLLS